MKKLQAFERDWILNVRYEIYFNDLLSKILAHLMENVKYQRVTKFLNANRGYSFLKQLKLMSEFTH
jgi:beta-xylosidase